MNEIFTLGNLVSLITLTFLEIILSIDNVIFVSILIGKLNRKQQLKARRIWMFAGIVVRSILLLCIGWLVNNGHMEVIKVFGYSFNIRNLILISGGLFLMYKTVKEIHDKLEGPADSSSSDKATSTFTRLIFEIILVDTVFSFDSIITAVGLANQVPVMIFAVSIAMVIMFFFSMTISAFINKHPSLKMLALSFLVLVGFSLFFDGLQPFHQKEIPKGYIYTAMAFALGVELLNIKFRKKTRAVKLKEPKMKA